MDDELLVVGQSALAEAKLLYRMIGPNHRVEKLRELIAVPPKIEKALRAYMKESPQDAEWIERSLEFRRDVLAEFNRLVEHLVTVGQGLQEPGQDLRGAKEAEPGSVAMAFASG